MPAENTIEPAAKAIRTDPVPSVGKGTRPRLVLATVGTLSFGSIIAEIAFTRVLSSILSYHYVFLVISTALLGLGIGGIVAYVLSNRGRAVASMPGLAVLFSLSTALSLFLISRLPGSTSFIVFGIPLLVPFVFVGAVTSIALSTETRKGIVYGVDLGGAAAGALAAVPLLNWAGPIQSVLLAGIMAGIAGIVTSLSSGTRTRWLSFPATALMVTIFVLGAFGNNLVVKALPLGQDKELASYLSDGQRDIGRILETRWTAFGRTDLVQSEADPSALNFFIDGTAGTPMYAWDGNLSKPDATIRALQHQFPGFFPFLFMDSNQLNNALIIGPGGGRDVLLALSAGFKHIDAVEVNGDLVDMAKEYSSINGGIYTKLPNVNVVSAEGRSYLQRAPTNYDAIMLSLAVTKTSRSPEGFALTENFLFTKQSFGDYLDHLNDGGQLIIVAHQPVEIAKLVSLAVSALEDRGVSAPDAFKQFYVVGNHHFPVFVLSKQDIPQTRSVLIHQALHASSYDVNSSYVPNIVNDKQTQMASYASCSMLNPALVSAEVGGTETWNRVKVAFLRTGYDVGTVTDDRPFFYNDQNGLPPSMPAALLIGGGILAASIAMYLLVFRKRHGKRRKGNYRAEIEFPMFFLLLGVGFMLIEIPLVQRFTLFLGNPMLSLTVLLFSLLAGAGLGSLLSGRILGALSTKRVAIVCVVVSAATIAYGLLTSVMLGPTLGLSLAGRSLIATAMLIPFGFLLGIPFPSGLRLLGSSANDARVPWMWAINGFASVLGSALAVVIAMKYGFSAAMTAGAVCYLLIAAASLGNRGKSPSPAGAKEP